jgi:hypothetical protein
MRFTVGAAALSLLALAGCGMMGGEGPTPDSPAARAPAALPPPMQPAPTPAPSTPAAAPLPEDLPALPADQVKCAPPWTAKQVTINGVTETRCSPP